MTEPIVSVVVPTHGRAALVDRLLVSLVDARRAVDGIVEVLIVDSSDASGAADIARSCETLDATYIRGGTSVRQKRNAGIAQASAPIILFIDSDVVADEHLIVRHLDTYAAQPHVGGVAGRTVFEGPIRPAWHVISQTKFVNVFEFAAMMPYAPWATCSNVSYRADALHEVGCFDEKFPFRLGGDDVDLGLRVNEAGYLIACEPGAVVLHARETWYPLSALVRRATRWGQMEYHLYMKHPRLRAVDAPRVTTTFALLLVVGLLLSVVGVTAAPLMLAVVWLAFMVFAVPCAEALAGRTEWRLVPARIVAYSIELMNEGATLFAFLAHGKPEGLWKRLLITRELPVYEWSARVTELWLQCLALIGLVLAWVWGLR